MGAAEGERTQTIANSSVGIFDQRAQRILAESMVVGERETVFDSEQWI